MQNIAHHRYYGAILLTQYPGKRSLQSIHKDTLSHGVHISFHSMIRRFCILFCLVSVYSLFILGLVF